jgi:hypothetical protein
MLIPFDCLFRMVGLFTPPEAPMRIFVPLVPLPPHPPPPVEKARSELRESPAQRLACQKRLSPAVELAEERLLPLESKVIFLGVATTVGELLKSFECLLGSMANLSPEITERQAIAEL